MNWEYIAGFFDGEGCISHTSAKARGMGFMVSFSQVDGAVLAEISAFLKERGISNGIKQYHYKKPFGWVKPQFRLYFSSRVAVTKFLENIWFRLHVKRQLALDTLRFLRIFPSLANGTLSAPVSVPGASLVATPN